ncbi:MAG: DNA recombination protein RmuC [Acidobacteriota bacterium]
MTLSLFAASLLALLLGGLLGYLLGRLPLGGLRAEREGLLSRLEESEARRRALEGELAAAGERRAAAEARLERLPALERRIVELEEERSRLLAEVREARTRLEEGQKAGEEKLALLQEAERKLAAAFEALSSQALERSGASFLRLARESLEKYHEAARGDLEARKTAVEALVAPLAEALKQVEGKIAELERARTEAYGSLKEQLRSLTEVHLPALRGETQNLVKALRRPSARGRWGEVQLRRVVELAGMVENCDFVEQETHQGAEGRQRPDLIVRLPGGKQVAVDAKAPLEAYLAALEADSDEERRRHLEAHARQVREHVRKLGQKAYWEALPDSVEFVVLFLPGESFFSAALEADPALLEAGAEQRVVLATPTTLIALLKAVAFGWRQEALAANARQISDLGRDVHRRLATLADHWMEVGKKLEGAVEAYNKATGSLESRVLVAARRFSELGASNPGEEIAAPPPVERLPRSLASPPPSGGGAPEG